MTDRRITRQQLLDYQATLRKAADGLDTAIQLADLDLTAIGAVTAGKPSATQSSRLSEEARERIAQANRAHWVTCPRPECKGVRHRKTHPHIQRQGSNTKTKGRSASKAGGS